MKKLNIKWVETEEIQDACLVDGIAFVRNIDSDYAFDNAYEIAEEILKETSNLTTDNFVVKVLNMNIPEIKMAEILFAFGFSLPKRDKDIISDIMKSVIESKKETVSGYCRWFSNKLYANDFPAPMAIGSSIVAMGAILHISSIIKKRMDKECKNNFGNFKNQVN